MRVSCEELFAPVIGADALQRPARRDRPRRRRASSASRPASSRTTCGSIDAAFDRIDVGGLNVNDVSTFRVDHMPYGGVKQSGFGREGLRYAIEEMTELKLVAFNRAI